MAFSYGIIVKSNLDARQFQAATTQLQKLSCMYVELYCHVNEKG